MNTYQKKNLLRIAEIVASLKPSQFDIGVIHECNSVGCALGWAASDPYFQKKGLTYNYLEETYCPSVSEIRYIEDAPEKDQKHFLKFSDNAFNYKKELGILKYEMDNPLREAFFYGAKIAYDSLDNEYKFDTPKNCANSILKWIEHKTGEVWELKSK